MVGETELRMPKNNRYTARNSIDPIATAARSRALKRPAITVSVNPMPTCDTWAMVRGPARRHRIALSVSSFARTYQRPSDTRSCPARSR